MSGKRAGRWLQAAAVVGIGGWMLILGTYLWWLLAPVTLPDVKTPIPVLNEGHEIAIGEPIVLKLTVDKPGGIRTTTSDRFLQCASGNLVTLTSTARDVPTGRFTIIADSVKLPAKVSPGDVCVFTYRNTYELNPVRSETLEWSSEQFTVVAPR